MDKKERIQRIKNLSEKELEVLELFCQPVSYKEISEKLFISEATVRTHMRTIYIKLDLLSYHTSIRRFKVIKEFCHLLNDPDYIEEEIKGEIDPGKAIIPIEPDEERDELVDEMIGEDEKLWLMEYQQEPIKIIPTKDQVEIIEPRRRIRPIQIIMAVLAFIGFIAIVITVYEWIRKDDVPSTSVAQEVPEQPSEVVETIPTEEAQQPAIVPTITQTIPTEIPTPEPTKPPQPAILFEDNFDNGLSNGWQVVSGNPVVVNGKLATDSEAWLMIGDPTWKDYAIELTTDAEGYREDFRDGFNAIGVRAVDIDNMYVYKWSEAESVCIIAEDGVWNEVPKCEFRPDDTEHQFRITIVGNKMSIYMDGELRASFFDDKYQSGKVALRVFDLATIDNFIVREIIE